MIGEKLAAVYSKLENGFYSILDFIDSKGVPVYSVIDPIEERGIPAFPLFIALLVILISALFAFSVVGTGIAPTFQFSIVDEQGNSLSGVIVSIYNGKGEKIADSITAGDKVSYKMEEKIPAGEKIRIVGRKDGYQEGEYVIPKLTEENLQIPLILEKIGGMVTGSIRFYDEISGTPIPYVEAIVLFDDESIERVSDNNGEISLGAIPKGKELLLRAFADGYEDYEEGISFESTYTKSVFMTPESIALEGESLLTITVIDKETREFIDGARVQVYDNETSALLIDKIIEAGVQSELVPKGTVVRIVAEKEGYVKYDSLDEEKVITIRAEHEDWGKVELSKGGELLQVNVIDSESEMPLIGAEITLFNSGGEVIDSGITEFGGFVEFRDLNANSTYFIGGQAEGYLPTTMEFIPKARKSIDFKLDRMTSSNSGMLIVHVIDSRRQEANNATLKFFEFAEEGIIPLGIKPQETSIDGSYSLKVALGKNVYVEAIKGLEKGDGNKLIETGTNDLLIELELSKTVKLLRFKDENGNYLQEGRVVIRSSDGLTLFDGNIEEGEILFDTFGNKYLEIEVTTPDGRKYTEQVTVGDEDEIEINVRPVSFSELAPEISFIEVRDLDGETVEGLTKGKEYVLVFETKWIEGRYNGGVHVRVGPDNIKYVDSQYVGIVGFDSLTKNYFYGRTYSGKNEGIDYSNKGKSGEYNKFLELYLDNPSGNKIIKVKVKVRETFNGETFQVHFRAWSNMSGSYYRAPEDAELGEEEFNELKSGLYAETFTKDIRVFDSEPTCSEEVCSSYLFLDDTMKAYERTEFFAVKDKVYALQFELSSEKSATATVNASTSKENPKIAFTGKELEVFSDTFIDNESSETAIQFNQSIPRDSPKKARIYFKANELGQALVKTQVIAGNSVLEESFYFRVYEEEEMLFTIEPSVISIGKDFLITLKSRSGEAITNADIKFFDSRGIMVEKIIGKDEAGKGRNGRYEVKNNFDAGKYFVEITSPRYTPVNTEIFIGREDGIKLDEEIMVDILYGEESRTIFSPVRNETTADLTNVSIELKYPINFPKELSLTAVIPEFIPKNEGTQIELSATYTGVKDEISHGEAEAIITGYAEGSYPIRAKTRIIVNYNRKLDPKCLKFDRPELKEYLIGVEGNSKQMELKIKNECGVPLTLIPEFVSRGEADEGLEFSFGEIKLMEGEEKTVKVSVMNK
ncbi:hypothetical protein KJ660_00730, partial [Candidatus Micrarchaeota archaeon]|nr:hypothetical protein [Candidatus Micrarchaeota archaeon]